jgi:hypothetical protein
MHNAMRGHRPHFFAYIGTFVFTVFYIGAIYYCGISGMNLSNTSLDIWKAVTAGRIITVLLFNSITILSIYGHSMAFEKINAACQPALVRRENNGEDR